MTLKVKRYAKRSPGGELRLASARSSPICKLGE
jgi:hypothetical protein